MCFGGNDQLMEADMFVDFTRNHCIATGCVSSEKSAIPQSGQPAPSAGSVLFMLSDMRAMHFDSLQL